ncbi:hypothetical protein Trydic_g11458 [Trypoxylus dichotomus]
MCRSLHPNAAVQRLYLPRREGGRGLINIEWLHNRLVIGAVYQIRRSSGPLIYMVRAAEKDGTQGSFLLKAAVRACHALKIPIDVAPASRKKVNILEKPKHLKEEHTNIANVVLRNRRIHHRCPRMACFIRWRTQSVCELLLFRRKR